MSQHQPKSKPPLLASRHITEIPKQAPAPKTESLTLNAYIYAGPSVQEQLAFSFQNGKCAKEKEMKSTIKELEKVIKGKKN